LVLELAEFVVIFCGVSTLRKLCVICLNSIDRSSALTHGDAGSVGGAVDVMLGCKKLFCEVLLDVEHVLQPHQFQMKDKSHWDYG
jgi:hypothetical protein